MRCACCFEQTERCTCNGDYKQDALLLPVGHQLNGGQYIVGKVLGNPGGFGIAYLGWDTRLEIKVAIKEYLPRHLARRSGTSTVVESHTRVDQTDFDHGLGQFLSEAKTLAQLRHSNIVRVLNYFEENKTGYIVMDYLDGESLQEYMSRTGPIRPEDAVALMTPILNALEYLHCNGIIHRDVKPSNIFITLAGHPVLLDFGSARQEMSNASMSMTAVVSAGYAPIEQYNRKGKQGPYTDIYSCAALLYQMISGIQPQESIERNIDEGLLPLNEVSINVSESLNHGIMWGLKINPKERPQDIETFVEALKLNPDPQSEILSQEQLEAPILVEGKNKESRVLQNDSKKKKPLKTKLTVAAIMLLVIFGGFVYWDSNRVQTIPYPLMTMKQTTTNIMGTYTGRLLWGKPNGIGTFKYSYTREDEGNYSWEYFFTTGIKRTVVDKVDVTYTGGFYNGFFEGSGTETIHTDSRFKVPLPNTPPDAINQVGIKIVEGNWVAGALNGKAKIEETGKEVKCEKKTKTADTSGFFDVSLNTTCIVEDYQKKFDGIIKDDYIYHGPGTLSIKRGKYFENYNGNWMDFRFTGKVDITSKEGRYVGEYVEDQPHGKGVFTYADGSKYDGMWENGKYSGKGEHTSTDKSRYIGSWKDGTPHGSGILFGSDRSATSGTWSEGKIITGEFIFPDGVKYVGAFKNGVPIGDNGQCRLILPNGRMVSAKCWETANGGFRCQWYE